MKGEDRLTIACKNYMALKHPNVIYFHVANERKTSKMRGGKLKRMGVLAGVVDCFVDAQVNGFGGLRIELKDKTVKDVKDGKPIYELKYPTAEQKEFLQRSHKAGYAVNVCWSIDDFMDTVDSYFDGSFAPCDYVNKLLKETK